MIRYIIASVGNKLKRERHCPQCGRFGGNVHGGISYRAVSDIKVSSIPRYLSEFLKVNNGVCDLRKVVW